MEPTREMVNEKFQALWKTKKFDTILGLTGATKFLYKNDDAYGLSGLGGVCGNGNR